MRTMANMEETMMFKVGADELSEDVYKRQQQGYLFFAIYLCIKL